MISTDRAMKSRGRQEVEHLFDLHSSLSTGSRNTNAEWQRQFWKVTGIRTGVTGCITINVTCLAGKISNDFVFDMNISPSLSMSVCLTRTENLIKFGTDYTKQT
jgi:hypothetical protein